MGPSAGALCRLNLASYVSTWMEDAADEIFSFAKNVNLADSVQYPSSALMERRHARQNLVSSLASTLSRIRALTRTLMVTLNLPLTARFRIVANDAPSIRFSPGL